MFLMFRYPDVAERQRMLWDAKYQTISKQLNITEAQEKKIKGKLELHAEIFQDLIWGWISAPCQLKNE